MLGLIPLLSFIWGGCRVRGAPLEPHTLPDVGEPGGPPQPRSAAPGPEQWGH